jgi:thiamine transport system permease protein
MTRRYLPLLPVLAFVVVVVLIPTLYVLGLGLGEAGGLSAVPQALRDPSNRLALENSLLQGGGSALLAGALGYPLGVLLGRRAFRGREAVSAFLLVPFLLPSLVVILGFQELVGPAGWLTSAWAPLGRFGDGLPGILAVNVYFNAAMVALLTRAAVEGSPREQEEAATLLGASPARVFRETWGPVSLLGAAAGMLLTFLLSALGFAAPLVVCGARCYTLEVQIWSLAEVLGAPALASVVALLTVLVLTVPTWLYLRTVHATRRRTARRTAPARPLDPRRLGDLAAMLYLAAILARSVFPSGTTFSPSGWQALFGPGVTDRIGVSTATAVGNTLGFAAGAALLAILLALATGYGRRRGAARGTALEYLLYLPLLVSPVLLAFGLATLARPWVGGASGTWLLILLSQAAVALPFTVQSLRLSLDRLPPAPWEAARTLGSRPFDAFLETDLPPARAGLIGAVLFAFAIGIGEFTATFFLVIPPWVTLPVELERLGALRLEPAADALGALLLLVSLGTFAAIVAGGRRDEL